MIFRRDKILRNIKMLPPSKRHYLMLNFLQIVQIIVVTVAECKRRFRISQRQNSIRDIKMLPPSKRPYLMLS